MTINSHYNELTYYDLAKKAREIADRIGCPLIEEGYYSDEKYGQEYKYDQLKITCYDKSNTIYIYINQTEVLFCNFNNHEIRFIDGIWKELIETIHKNTDSISNKRKKETLRRDSIVNGMLGMQEYFKYYLECKNKTELYDELNSNLKSNGILVSSRKEYSLIQNLCTGDYVESAVADNIYTISYFGSNVAQFNGNVFNIFPNINWYADKFEPGAWTKIFQKEILTIMSKEKNFTRQKVDNIADKLLKKIQKHNKFF